LHAGLPAVCLDHHGAREIMQPEFGCITQPEHLRAAIEEMLSNDSTKMSEAAKAYARQLPFSATAARLASLITQAEAHRTPKPDSQTSYIP
jgi:glycosyltransferase involved in cell wall biosynthesis